MMSSVASSWSRRMIHRRNFNIFQNSVIFWLSKRSVYFDYVRTESVTSQKWRFSRRRRTQKLEFWIFSKVYKGYLYLILKLTLCSFIRYVWILSTIGYLWGISMSKMAFLVVNLTIFWKPKRRLAEKTLKFDHIVSYLAKMHKVNPFSIHFYY